MSDSRSSTYHVVGDIASRDSSADHKSMVKHTVKINAWIFFWCGMSSNLRLAKCKPDTHSNTVCTGSFPFRLSHPKSDLRKCNFGLRNISQPVFTDPLNE